MKAQHKDYYYHRFKGASRSEINRELIELTNWLIDKYPNGYVTHLKTNQKRVALLELLKEKKKLLSKHREIPSAYLCRF